MKMSKIAMPGLGLATRNNINKRIAVVLYGKLIAAPIVKAELTGGRVAIGAVETPTEEFKALAEKLHQDIKK